VWKGQFIPVVFLNPHHEITIKCVVEKDVRVDSLSFFLSHDAAETETGRTSSIQHALAYIHQFHFKGKPVEPNRLAFDGSKKKIFSIRQSEQLSIEEVATDGFFDWKHLFSNADGF